jgi:hypothetical protein
MIKDFLEAPVSTIGCPQADWSVFLLKDQCILFVTKVVRVGSGTKKTTSTIVSFTDLHWSLISRPNSYTRVSFIIFLLWPQWNSDRYKIPLQLPKWICSGLKWTLPFLLPFDIIPPAPTNWICVNSLTHLYAPWIWTRIDMQNI